VLIDGLADDEIAGRLDAPALATAEFYLENFAGAGSRRSALRIGRIVGKGDLFRSSSPCRRQPLGSGPDGGGGRVLDGAIAAARLVDNPQGLAWNLFNRSAAFAAGDIDLASAAGGTDLRRSTSVRPAHAAVALAYARFETVAERCAELPVEFAGGNELRLIGSWRPGTRASHPRFPRGGSARPEHAAALRGLRQAGSSDGGAMAGLAAARSISTTANRRPAERAPSAAAASRRSGIFDAATSRLFAGRALAEAAETERAAAELELAAAAFESFGSDRYRHQAERELRKLGRSVHRRTRPGKADGSGVDSLTERELQIARLVVDRKTNPQIAAELFLSSKTVESHLRQYLPQARRRIARRSGPHVERAERASGRTLACRRERRDSNPRPPT
jgi:hypothetical protein